MRASRAEVHHHAPQGCLLFSEFVNKVRSAEDLDFYIHCEHFEEMCKLIKKKSRKHGAYSSNHSHHNRHSRVKSYQVDPDLGDVKAAGLSVGMAPSGAAAGSTASDSAEIAGTAVC
jgi:hypothetical protein